MTGGSVGSPAARAGGVVSRLGGGEWGYISPPIFFVAEEHPSSPIDRAARRWEGLRCWRSSEFHVGLERRVPIQSRELE
jgi:hypothetical protein